MRIGIAKELSEDATLVAATPDTATKLIKLGFELCIEQGAGQHASFADESYEACGAKVVSHEDVWASDIVVCLDAPSPDSQEIASLREGSTLIARMNPNANEKLLDALAARHANALAIDMVPRLSRAQALDVRSSMMNVAGNRAVIEAASAFGRLFGGQVTAAGKSAPAKVYVIGVGVAGLAAIGAAISMGAQVYATDVRAEVADQVESLGATFVEIPVVQQSTDGYAKALTDDQQNVVLKVYERQAAQSDIVITTAAVPNRPAPLLLTKEAVEGMKQGSVIVDMGASKLGGNCAMTRFGESITTDNGVKILGYPDLASRLPGQSSQLFGQNIVNLFKLITPHKDGVVSFDMDDEVIRGMAAVHEGAITWPPPAVKVSVAPAKSKEDGPEKTASKAAAADSAQLEEEDGDKGVIIKAALSVLAACLLMALVYFAPSSMQSHFMVFALACVVGFYVITGVSHSLHTPLMSVTNAISGIIIVGAILLIGSASPLVAGLSFVAMCIASINIFGGFFVTRRMLKMFKGSSE